MVESTFGMLEGLHKVVLAREGGNVEVEIQTHMMNVTSDIISRTAFGSSYERGKKVFEQLCTLIKLMVDNDYLLSIPVLRFLASPRPSFPTNPIVGNFKTMVLFVRNWSPIIFHWLFCIITSRFFFHLWCMLGGRGCISMKSNLFCSMRGKLIFVPLAMSKRVGPQYNDIDFFFYYK